MRNDTTVHLFYHFKRPGGLHLVSMSCIALFIIFLPSLFSINLLGITIWLKFYRNFSYEQDDFYWYVLYD